MENKTPFPRRHLE